MRLSLSVALAVAAAVGQPAAASPYQDPLPAPTIEAAAVELPLILAEGRLLVPIHIDGIGETFFILDTAASGHAISSSLRQRLALSPDMIREQNVQGSTGSTMMEFVQLPTMALGGRTHGDQWAVVADISDFRDYDGRPVTGILGTDILAEYDVEIDVPAGKLRLHPHGAPALASSGGLSIPFHSHGDTNFVQFGARIDGKPVNVLLDTGARNGILNWKAAGLAGVSPASAGLIQEQDGSKGIAGQRIPQYRYSFDNICFQQHCLPARDLRIADLPVFGIVGWEDQPAMLIGVEWLKTCPVLISYGRNRLRLCDQPAA